MSFMSKIFGLVRLSERTWIEGMYLSLKIRRGQRQTRLAGVTTKRPWFSMVEEKRFRSQQLARKAQVESVIRLSMAR